MTDEERIEARRAKDRERYWADPEKARARVRGYYAANAENRRAYQIAYKQDDPEKVREIEKRSMAKPERKARKKQTLAQWRAANYDHIRQYDKTYTAKNRERINAATRERYAKDPAKVLAQLQAREAKKLGNGPVETFTRMEIYERDSGRCHLCGGKVPSDGFHIDHLVPIARGGTHQRANVAVAHPFCNVQRGAGRTPAQLRLLG